jgi:polyisoprenoid-binding protein YceI
MKSTTMETASDVLTYKIDARRSSFTVQVFVTGVLSTFGHNPNIAIRDFSGQVQAVPNSPGASSVKIKIRTESFDVTDNIKDDDRREIEKAMRNEVLETSRFPEIHFQSTRISGDKIFENMYRVVIEGNLFLHGVTKKQNIEAQVNLSQDTLQAQGTFSLRLTDFNIKLVSAAAGMLKVKDEVQVSFSIVASP